MQHQGLVALAALLSAAVLAPGANAAPLTRERAQTAPVDAIVREAMGAVAPRFVEISRPTYSGMIAPGKTVSGLRMATAPRGAGSPGLCEADTVWIDFDQRRAPIVSQKVYKVVGPLAPLPDVWNDAYGASLERRCAAAGPVITPQDGDMDGVSFFAMLNAPSPQDKAWLAVRALEKAQEAARRGALDVSCERRSQPLSTPPTDRFEDRMEVEGRAGCAAPVKTLAGLDLGRLNLIDITPCPPDGGKAPAENLCLSANFQRAGTDGQRAVWIVNLRARHSETGDFDVETVSAVTLTDQVWIYD